ncbi:hypothetical protein ADUPG1_013445 [Aduncisulcus paluster]|uniref:Uncharacterized protein n=1 Tax=Aduncisulcus paluster TaxID=2918883 RepID=A0ABQ5K6K2_9EUKA|nr:hypothetical protein ADUPG1_013445 [Aduncisulcus paluster]
MDVAIFYSKCRYKAALFIRGEEKRSFKQSLAIVSEAIEEVSIEFWAENIILPEYSIDIVEDMLYHELLFTGSIVAGISNDPALFLSLSPIDLSLFPPRIPFPSDFFITSPSTASHPEVIGCLLNSSLDAKISTTEFPSKKNKSFKTRSLDELLGVLKLEALSLDEKGEIRKKLNLVLNPNISRSKHRIRKKSCSKSQKITPSIETKLSPYLRHVQEIERKEREKKFHLSHSAPDSFVEPEYEYEYEYDTCIAQPRSKDVCTSSPPQIQDSLSLLKPSRITVDDKSPAPCSLTSTMVSLPSPSVLDHTQFTLLPDGSVEHQSAGKRRHLQIECGIKLESVECTRKPSIHQVTKVDQPVSANEISFDSISPIISQANKSDLFAPSMRPSLAPISALICSRLGIHVIPTMSSLDTHTCLDSLSAIYSALSRLEKGQQLHEYSIPSSHAPKHDILLHSHVMTDVQVLWLELWSALVSESHCSLKSIVQCASVCVGISEDICEKFISTFYLLMITRDMEIKECAQAATLAIAKFEGRFPDDISQYSQKRHIMSGMSTEEGDLGTKYDNPISTNASESQAQIKSSTYFEENDNISKLDIMDEMKGDSKEEEEE